MDSAIVLDDDLAQAFTHRSEQDLFLASDINSLDLEENILNTSESIEQSNWYTSQSDFFIASSESAASSTSNHQRRRRRKKLAPYKTRRANPEKRRYQCTFCTDVFKTKHDWQRHERSLHLSLDEWRCSRFGPVFLDIDGTYCCVFCGDQSPTDAHLERHSYSSCAARPVADRVFFRKDHLLQHLRAVHNGCKFNDRMMNWISTIDTVHSRCGFCDLQMTTWAEREKHLAEHFKSGSDMKDWTGDRGFDATIENLVRDDIPPYMIAQQRETMDPFSASRSYHCIGQKITDVADQESPALSSDLAHNVHSHRHIEHLLLAHVSREICQGRVPSDSQIRKQMGILMYGPDHDDWEQTWADNEQWLTQFRKKAGLISLPLSDGRNAFVGYDTS
ncbi:hypothetical protein BU24DRAFT_387687 [Aaosphaeria arxii CBS 175.79]|uniref:C2H2-type domain-containing protein n=1 Tax=Aaosphaeria arxii CBS 175.79 TaxID=1450172 RepID=A0A6A5XW55_9PLEO|nr:uncharacterized protein BU24DRAFT_387687 [Aaosphaeria arxii CBS 175.79]KAF2016870.1 hypothetical protein BU24DRAFT_387687 [Aaosphaeria arxii CBS 175.79]